MNAAPPPLLRLLSPALGIALAFGLAACASRPAPEKRFAKHPELAAKLSPREQEIARRGEIAEGMSQDAVFLAWGRPDVVRTGRREGQGSERWAYLSRGGVHTTSVGFSTGSYSGFHTGFGYEHGGPFFGLGNDPYYPHHVDRSVDFLNDRVTAWESRR